MIYEGKCDSCRYATELADKTMRCQRFPPVPSARRVEAAFGGSGRVYLTAWEFPVVRPDDSCGEYK